MNKLIALFVLWTSCVFAQPTPINDELEFTEDCYFDGNVGIGTITPTAKLYVQKDNYYLYVDSGFFFFTDTAEVGGGIGWTPVAGSHNRKKYGHITGINYNIEDSTDLGCEVGIRESGGAHVAQIEFHGNTATGVGHVHIDVMDTAANEMQLHFETADSNVVFGTNGNGFVFEPLAGSGTRLVTASATGVLATETIANVSPWTGDGTNVYLRDSSDNVGIGTMSPAFKLHVAGELWVQNYNGNTSQIRGYSADSLTGTIFSNDAIATSIQNHSGISALSINTDSSASLVGDSVIIEGFSKLILNALFGANVGIGTATPAFKLTVSAADSVIGIVADSGAITYDGTNFLLSASGTTAKFDISLDDGSAPTMEFNVNPTTGLNITSSINTTAGDDATIDAPAGRFRKDTSGDAFTLTNSFITANSIIQLTPANAAIDGTATTWTVSAGAGSATITFNAAPTANFDMNFFVIN